MSRQASYLLITVLFGIVIGVVVAPRLTRDDVLVDQVSTNSSQSPAEQGLVSGMGDIEPAQFAEVLQSLTNTMNEEIRERRLLAQQVEELQAEVAELRKARGGDEEEAPERVVNFQAMEDRFTEMGFTSQERESLWRLEAARQVQQVELNDRARREGWIDTSRYNEEMEALSTFNSPVRNELGDDRYDRYLYAMGRPNRVIVGGVMPTSQAEKAGLSRGDVVVRYGGESVYSNLHLIKLRSSGEAGAPVVVEINRDGQPMQVTMPRGPMGFGGSVESIDPRTNIQQGSE